MSLKKTAQELFGGSGYGPPSLAEIAEHSRVGEVSTGRPFKYSQIAPSAYRFASNASLAYYGFAAPGSPTDEGLWRIMRMDHANTFLDFADGDDKFDNVWDDRESLTYV